MSAPFFPYARRINADCLKADPLSDLQSASIRPREKPLTAYNPSVLALRHLIFTELDNVLLDPRSQSWAAAEEALEEIARRRIPLVFVTGRTRAELDALRRKMGHEHPFITENGGGIFIPEGYFNVKIPGAERIGHQFCLPLARPYAEAVEALREISEASGAGVAGFSDLSVKEIAENTGLSQSDADLARRRDFDEPFFFAGASDASIQKFLAEARLRKATVEQGDRFWHLSLGGDKGRAVSELIKLYRSALRSRFTTVGLAAAEIDVSFLQKVDIPVVLPCANGVARDIEALPLPRAVRPSERGPRGWNAAILGILNPPAR
jgi:mannosyl-3-phosphoglycerate phosphatase